MINMCKSMSKTPKKLSGVEWVMGSVYNGFIFNDPPHKIISHKINSFYVTSKLFCICWGQVLDLKLWVSRHLLVQSQQWKYQNNMWDLSKINKKQNDDVVLVFSLLVLNKFYICLLSLTYFSPIIFSFNVFSQAAFTCL